MASIKTRKQQHIKLAQEPNSQIKSEIFENIYLKYKTLPEINLKDVDTSTTLLGKNLIQPLIIASMTGGTEKAKRINENISIAARETGVAFGVGSQRVTLKDKAAENSFKVVRKNAPNSIIFANMGAIQLNYEAKIEDYQRVVDMIKADAIYLHLNALQEAVQPEGDTDFKELLEKISKLINKLSVPVFVKEVGHGIDYETAKNLVQMRVQGIDVAGANGTSWAWIEAKRKNGGNLGEWFKDFGISTEESIRNVMKVKGKSKISVIASGGIRNPIHALKARTIGTNYYSAAYPFLKPALEESPKKLIDTINEWQKGLKIAMFCTGQTSWEKI